MPRYMLKVAYDGTWFHGWQKQRRTTPLVVTETLGSQGTGIAIPGLPDADDSSAPAALRTVQSVLERAVQEVVGEPVSVLGASRTDSGVHAVCQIAAFTTTREIPVEKLPAAITARLPHDVIVRRAQIVPETFDPIKNAVAKGYAYRIAHGRKMRARPLFNRHFTTRLPFVLDAVRMNEAARLLLGEHDFTSFARINHGRETAVRTIYDCRVMITGKHRLRIDVAGNGFLYNMVRIIAGTLVQVGRGLIEPEKMPEILAAKDRRAAGPTLPPTGLCLMWIRYPEAPAANPA